MKNNLRIAIDGGAATGKSTVSKKVAKKLNLTYVNTGQMYRLIAFFALTNNLGKNEDKLYQRIKNMNVSFDNDGFITSDLLSFKKEDLETKIVSSTASLIATYKKIREVSVEVQKKIGRTKGVLLEGRDIGTIIMPDADFKFFLVVDPKTAAIRRVDQHKKNGEEVSFDDVLKDIINRNKQDTTRKIGPLLKSSDSIIIDTSNKNIEKIVLEILRVIENG